MASGRVSSSDFPPGYLEEYNGDSLLAIGIVFIILEVVFVALRFWARRIGQVAWGADDGLIIAGLIFCEGLIACGFAELRHAGVGYHQAAVVATSPSKLITWRKYTLIMPLVYLVAVILPKLAIITMYLRIFTQRSDRMICWIVAAGMIGNSIGAAIAGFFSCIPLEFLWDRTIPGGRCFNINAWFRWSSLMNIITDVVMLILPIPMVWKMQSSRKVKIGLTITFAIGSMGLITSIVRFAGFFRADVSVDGTWSATERIIVTFVETGMYLIAACLPTYRPLAIIFWNRTPLSSHLLRSRTSKTGQSTDEQGTCGISLKSRQDNSFTRLNEDEERLPSQCEDEAVEQTTYLGTMPKDSRNIILRHDIDMVSHRPTLNGNDV